MVLLTSPGSHRYAAASPAAALAMLLLLPHLGALATTVPDYAVCASAATQVTPPRITLSWPVDPLASSYRIYRRPDVRSAWSQVSTLPAGSASFEDVNVAAGQSYEYRISKVAGPGGVDAEGYVFAGIQASLMENRGKILLLVDAKLGSALPLELERLRLDLAGDGWTVVSKEVAPGTSVPAVKAIITSEYSSIGGLEAVFLFGHIPVPYSGSLNPDGHPDHSGAWPADVYYGDVNGTWTDTQVNNKAASYSRNWNVPGDGKFDQTTLPSDVELQVGRVDLSNLPTFKQNENELARQYLNKNHRFRHNRIAVERRGLITDGFGVFNDEPFAAPGWRNFSAFFGPGKTVPQAWMSALSSQSYLWGYGCGAGTYSSATGVGSTRALSTNDPQVVFTMLFGSYFADWDNTDNFLRAQLATPGYTLTSAWVGRPYWEFHHMALGESIGFSTRLSQNNSGNYTANNNTRKIHMALMGDPTLRMHPVSPPQDLRLQVAGSDTVLSWTPSPDSTVAGYHVYSALSASGPFTRLSNALVEGTTYTDRSGGPGVYMVRAVKLETAGSGTYYNGSQGIMCGTEGSLAPPTVLLKLAGTNTTFALDPIVQFRLSNLDPAGTITNVTLLANGTPVVRLAPDQYSCLWSNVSAGAYTVVAQAQCSSGYNTNSPAISLTVGATSPRLNITPLGSNQFRIRGVTDPGRTLRIEARNGFNAQWQTLTTATADNTGAFEYVDSSVSDGRAYRTACP